MNTSWLKNNEFSGIRWTLIVIYLIISLIGAFWRSPVIMQISPIITVLAIFSVIWLHGTARYGLKNMFIFFLITWVISNFFEALSIRTGFPFGNYYYDHLAGPRLFDVPLIIMFAYFSTGYSSWILAHILLGQCQKNLMGKSIITVPLIAAFLMVMWDLCIDPLCSTIASLWVWRNGGIYFGVPLQNYFGWFLVVLIIYLVFAIYLAKFNSINTVKNNLFISKTYWLEMVAVYGILGLTQWFQYWGATEHREIYGSMALVTVFTMMFVTLLSFIKIYEFAE